MININYLRRREARTVFFQEENGKTQLVLRNFDPETGEPLPETILDITQEEIGFRLAQAQDTAMQLAMMFEDLTQFLESRKNGDQE